MTKLLSTSGLMIASIASLCRRASSFVPRSNFLSVAFSRSSTLTVRSQTAAMSLSLPTMEEVTNDPFMQQVGHGSMIASALSSETNNEKEDQIITELLSAQLSHSDGIRGFFVSYLTSDSDSEDDEIGNEDDAIPSALVSAMGKVSKDELIPLACMNVIMPTGMITMHTDPNLSSSSSKTAEKGKNVLAALKQVSQGHEASIEKICCAVHAVATDDNDENCDEEQFEYWTKFFKKWGYKEQQKKDIALAISSFM